MFEHLIQNLFPALEHFHSLGYWLAFLAALLETTFVVGMFLPGSTVLLLIGALSAAGRLDFQGVLWFAVAGAILGDNLNYWLGKRYGQRWLRTGIWFLKQEHFEQARAFFDRHGARGVFLGRFVPTMKEIVPFIAGSVGMRYRTFLLWNVLGAVGWGLEWVGGGYLFARSLDLAEIWLPRFGLLVAALLILSLLFWLLKRFVIRHGHQWWRFAVSVSSEIGKALRRNPEVRRLIRSHPGFFAFLSHRLDRRRFTGLPLTLLGLAFAYLLFLFGGLVEDLLDSDPIVFLDKALAHLIASVRTREVIDAAYWITLLGAWQVVVPALLVALLILSRLAGPLAALPAAAGVLGSTLFTALGKLALHRPRPPVAIVSEHSYAFPSGHATVAVAFYGFIGYLLIRHARSWPRRVDIFFGTLFLILLLGASRIVLGVHYLSDVLSGYLVGGLWLILAISLNEWLYSLGRIRFVPRPRQRLFTRMGVAAVFLWYLAFGALHPVPLIHPRPAAVTHIDGDPVDYLRSHGLTHTRTLLGRPLQPLSLLILAPDDCSLVQGFLESGWHPPEHAGPLALIQRLRQGNGEDNPPVAPAFWNDRPADFTFEYHLGREHGNRLLVLQLWRTGLGTTAGRVYVGTVRALLGTWWLLLHRLDPDLDQARDMALQRLRRGTRLMDLRRIPFVPTEVGETPTGQKFFSRGKLVVFRLPSSDRCGKTVNRGEEKGR